MIAQHLRLELIACPRYFTQSMRVFQDYSRRERRDSRLNMPVVHRAQLRRRAGNLDRHRIVGKFGRHHVVVHIDPPIACFVLAHNVGVGVFSAPAEKRFAEIRSLSSQTYLIAISSVNINGI